MSFLKFVVEKMTKKNILTKLAKNVKRHHMLCCALIVGTVIMSFTDEDTHYVNAQNHAEIQLQTEQQLNDVENRVAVLHEQLEATSKQIKAEKAERERIAEEKRKEKEIADMKVNAREVSVQLTYYTASADECGSDSGITASGTVATAGRTIACNFLPIGTRVMIDGNVYVVEDRGGMSGHVIDIFVNSKSEAFALGRRYTTAYILD